MKSARLTILLAAFTVGLLAVVVWQACLLHELRTTSREQALSIHSLSSSSGLDLSNETNPSSGSGTIGELQTGSQATLFTTNGLKFDWRQVESEDYRTYIQNLRRIGCPEETVRDIVKADVLQAFATQRSKIMADRYQGFSYWKTDPEEANVRVNLEKRQREVDATMGNAIHELLGEDVLPPPSAAAWRQAALPQQLAFLSSDTRDRTIALLQHYADVDEQVWELSRKHSIPEGREERLRVMENYNQKREALNAILTPDEYELMEMNVSWTASNLRQAMAKFQPTEEEFRAIFREWRSQDEQLAVIFARGLPDPGNAHVFANIAKVLTPERYEKYRATWWK